jgi:hypothetical protein
MTDDQIQLAFAEWWKDSFPLMPPNSRTIDTHVAFASHVLAMVELLAEYEDSKAS